MNNKDRLFIGSEVEKAARHGVDLKFFADSTIERCSGFFREEPLELVLATQRPKIDWFGIFVHEGCHLDQFLEQIPLWLHPSINTDSDVMDEYTTGIRKNKTKVVREYLKGMLRLEIDCENRAVGKIKRHSLSLPLDDYIKKANCYLYSYRAFYELRGWYKYPKVPSRDKKIMATIPTKLLSFDEYWEGHELIHQFLLEYGEFLG